MTDDTWPAPTTDAADAVSWPPADDSRFTYGLVFDVADVLVDHGYAAMAGWTGQHFVELQQGLWRALYSGDAPIARISSTTATTAADADAEPGGGS
jgi:hypothetical protein